MRLIILDRDELVGEWAAKYVVKRINEFQPNKDKYFVLGLPTGMRSFSSNTLPNVDVFLLKFRLDAFKNVLKIGRLL